MDEKTLITDLKKDKIISFEKIFSLYHRCIYNFCISLYQSPDDAEETVQKVFVALWEQREQVDENKPLGSYLYSIARYMIYSDFRRKVYKKAAFDHFAFNSPETNNSTKDDVLFNELLTFLESQIEKLPERQREVIKLSRYEGLTYRQIAKQLNISENTVDTQIRRALDFLRNKFENHYK
jgi:RNA polymerase sigma-70 factor (ECF subfamily)